MASYLTFQKIQIVKMNIENWMWSYQIPTKDFIVKIEKE